MDIGGRELRAWHVHTLTIVVSIIYFIPIWLAFTSPDIGFGAFALPLVIGITIFYFGVMFGILVLMIHRYLKYGAILGLALLILVIIIANLEGDGFDGTSVPLLLLLTVTLIMAVRENWPGQKAG